MTEMTTEDGQAVPAPDFSEFHIYGFEKIRDGRRVRITVREVRYPGLVILRVIEEPDGCDFLTLNYLAGIVALRLAKGHRIVAADRYQFVLSPPVAKKTVTAGTPVCDRCGSDRVVRDASAHWDRHVGEWTLAGVHDYAFCDACESEGEDLIRCPDEDSDLRTGGAEVRP